ncbi:uncharacterized protein LOC127565786 [Drosophila albomicans]|uniref:Uncharacterized protein LOC127565786 n=1 Tax=Drosophila albomicans TaxID=7291 RepID=A0A9C6T938_DROAB|nr:uncharacterized protein LOC127565786 [Drosophila albomicans]
MEENLSEDSLDNGGVNCEDVNRDYMDGGKRAWGDDKVDKYEFQREYGAVIYVHVETTNRVITHLLIAKSRVGPVKSLSVPRLELCGAVLLAELSSALLLKLPDESFRTFWTNLTIVLAWLNKPPYKR